MKVLTVENNIELLKLVTHLLEKEGFDALTAAGGQEALAIFAAEKPDIVCLDIGLDDMSGHDVCRQLRAADPDLPILVITSKSRSVDISEGMEAGATEYIIKPFDLRALVTLLREIACGCIARNNPGGLEESFDLGPIRVFPARLCGERRGKTIDLTLREVRILRLFHEHQGDAVPAEALVAACFSGDVAAGSAAVRWHIEQLRRKIDEAPGSPSLLRQEGAGYRFG